MKTSNKLFIAAVGLLLGSLVTYDAALRAEYRTGHYKDPLFGYDALAYHSFDEVAVPAASRVSVKVVAGPFGVHVKKEVAEFVRVTQQGKTLTVSLTYPEKQEWLGRGDAVVISCPRLQTLTTDGIYVVAEKTKVEKLPEYNNWGKVTVQGFSQDSLTLRQDHASAVKLAGNTLGFLRARAGISLGSGSALSVDKDNHIQAADFALAHRSRLNLEAVIPKLRQQFSDSAEVTFSGAAAHGLSTE